MKSHSQLEDILTSPVYIGKDVGTKKNEDVQRYKSEEHKESQVIRKHQSNHMRLSSSKLDHWF